jgi:GNAT superfamily N-acetyltransferase
MTKTALFIRHKAQPGRRDDVQRIWEKHVKPRVEANPAHEEMVHIFWPSVGERSTLNHIRLMANSTFTTAGATDLALRLAREGDVPALETLIPLSVWALQAPVYSAAQIGAALGPVFGVDRQLIRDGTYFVAELRGEIVGCGGWSRRRSLYGSDRGRAEEDAVLDPRHDAARVRAFFVHPMWARRGIGRSIMIACEQAIIDAGFHTVEIVATLAGEPLFASFEYAVVERYNIALAGGLSLAVVRMSKSMKGGA